MSNVSLQLTAEFLHPLWYGKRTLLLVIVLGLLCNGCGVFRIETEIVPLAPATTIPTSPPVAAGMRNGASPLPSPPPATPTTILPTTATSLPASYPTLSATYLTSEAEYNRMLRENPPTPWPLVTSTPFYTLVPLPQASNQLRFEGRSGYQETPRFQITFDATQWLIAETVLHYQQIPGCQLDLYPGVGEARGPMQKSQVILANIPWEVRFFPSERLVSYYGSTPQLAVYFFVVTYGENADSAAIAACRAAAEAILQTFVEVDGTQDTAHTPQANEASAQLTEGIWQGWPTYGGPDAPYWWQLHYEPEYWHLENDKILLNAALPSCQMNPTGGRGLSPNQTHENYSVTLGKFVFAVTMVYTDGIPDFANYYIDINEKLTGFQISFGDNVEECRGHAEQVLKSLAIVARPNP